MSILIPIQDDLTSEVTVAVVFAGNSDLASTANMLLGLRTNLIGGTQIQTISSDQTAGASIGGGTALAPMARLNSEPNIFAAVNFGGASALAPGPPSSGMEAVAVLAGSTGFTATLLQEAPEEFGFTIFVDVLDSAVASSQDGHIRRYKGRLLVDGVDIPIRHAELQASVDTLGTELKVTMARPLVNQVVNASSVTFQIGIWTGAAYQYINIIAGGKLSARENAIKNTEGRPTDEVSISIIDIIADRWNRAPRAPIHLYDPNKVSAPTQSEMASEKIIVATGGTITPVNVPIFGMRLRDVLHRAYVIGTGFASVITNIPNFPVSEADFTLDGGYDGGVRPLLSLFSPLLFTDSINNLFIIDPDASLPAGFTPRDFAESNIVQMDDNLPQREPVNAILVRMRSNDGGEVYTERLDQETQQSGTFSTPSYTRTDVVRRVREFRNLADPETIVREEVVGETTTVTDWEFAPIEVTTLVDHFDTQGRKTGYSRDVSRRLPDPGNEGTPTLFEHAQMQEQTIIYTTNPLNPSEDVQERVTTVESGLILVDDSRDYLGEPFKLPLTEAHISGYIDPDADMHVESGDIKTTVEQLRIRGQQVDVEVRVINHLANTPARTSVTSRPGSVTLDRKQQGASRTVLLTVEGTEPDGRRVQVFDAGDLPSDIALDLGRRKLARLNNPPREIQILPAFIDLSIRRGAILRPHGRGEAVLGTYIVTGYTITINEYAQNRGIIGEMNITARELML